MALALAQYEDLSSLLVVTFIGVRMACQIVYSVASVPLCIGCLSLCHREGGSTSAYQVNLMALTC